MDRELQDAALCTAQIVNREGRLDATVRQVEQVIMGE